MAIQGLIGFRHNDADKLIYNHSKSQPDRLGSDILKEVRAVEYWDVIRTRIEDLLCLPEERKLGESTSMAEIELRRHFPDLEYPNSPTDVHQLYRPLQGTLKPYLEGRLMFMPNASDFVYDSRHCEWAYIVNLDTEQFEVWKGNQLKQDFENHYGQEPDRMGYYPCSMLMGYALDDLPDPVRFMADYTFYQDLNDA